MDTLVRRFKETGQALGLITAQYDANLPPGLTQLPETSSSSSESQSTTTASLQDVHEMLQAARTFAKYGSNGGEVWREEHAVLVQNHEQHLVQAAVRKKGTTTTEPTEKAAVAKSTERGKDTKDVVDDNIKEKINLDTLVNKTASLKY